MLCGTNYLSTDLSNSNHVSKPSELVKSAPVAMLTELLEVVGLRSAADVLAAHGLEL